MSCQSHCGIVYQHRADNFDKWLTSTCDSGVIELHNVAAGPARDYAAVKAAFTLPWSNRTVDLNYPNQGNRHSFTLWLIPLLRVPRCEATIKLHRFD